jgi:hypothetical protein
LLKGDPENTAKAEEAFRTAIALAMDPRTYSVDKLTPNGRLPTMAELSQKS